MVFLTSPVRCLLISLMGLLIAARTTAAALPDGEEHLANMHTHDVSRAETDTSLWHASTDWLRRAWWWGGDVPTDQTGNPSRDLPLVYVQLEPDNTLRPAVAGASQTPAQAEVLDQPTDAWIGPESGDPAADAAAMESLPAEGDCDCDECRARGLAGNGPFRERPRGRIRQWWQGLGPDGPRGEPLHGESWLNRPFSLGMFVGMLALSDPSDGLVEGNTSLFVGTRAGWDFSIHHGIEARLGYAPVALNYPQDALLRGDMDAYYVDAHWHYYPWGDTRWRPYFSIGAGMADFHFPDHLGIERHETLFGLPWGVGVKYRLSSRVVFRAELLDNFNVAAGDVDSMHNVSLTAGLEWRLGGGNSRKSYFPWNASRSWW